MQINKWDVRFMRIARELSSWSKDPSTKVGALLVKDRRVVATGYNGFPENIADDGRLGVREQKYTLVIHAEMNALMNALKFGVAAENATLFVYPLAVCSECMKHVIQAGVKRLVIINPQTYFASVPKWKDLWYNTSLPMLLEANLELTVLEESDLDK